jgi:hypothetical protein
MKASSLASLRSILLALLSTFWLLLSRRRSDRLGALPLTALQLVVTCRLCSPRATIRFPPISKRCSPLTWGPVTRLRNLG